MFQMAVVNLMIVEQIGNHLRMKYHQYGRATTTAKFSKQVEYDMQTISVWPHYWYTKCFTFLFDNLLPHLHWEYIFIIAHMATILATWPLKAAQALIVASFSECEGQLTGATWCSDILSGYLVVMGGQTATGGNKSPNPGGICWDGETSFLWGRRPSQYKDAALPVYRFPL